MIRVLTYGTFDLLHHGHVRLLKRAAELGDYLMVAVSTDKFNAGKGKASYHDYATRAEIVRAIRYVDEVIPEHSWEQKVEDILDNEIDIVVMGADWADSDKFDYLRAYCQLVFLPRTEGISTTEIKENLMAAGEDVEEKEVSDEPAPGFDRGSIPTSVTNKDVDELSAAIGGGE
jgi:glycerol-3-phosphate cytidylyltransferase